MKPCHVRYACRTQVTCVFYEFVYVSACHVHVDVVMSVKHRKARLLVKCKSDLFP